jgi:Transposase DDE domain
MFVRVKRVRTNGRDYRYLQVVETRRERGRVTQHLVANFGRLDEVVASGDLDRVIEGLVAHSQTLQLIQRYRGGTLQATSDKVWGPVLIFERLWEDLEVPALLRRLGRRRRLAFDFERVVFALVLQRILAPGSDRAGVKWAETVHARGFETLRLPHYYRALRVLWAKKVPIEQALYEKGLDLFNQPLDLVFFDTTSLYFEGAGPEGLARLGKSKDHRPDHPQVILGILMRRDGLPIACEVWPGNTADVTRVTVIADLLRKRFAIQRVVVVCDRGMVSAKNLAALEALGFQSIVGVKMRGVREVRDEVLARAGRYQLVRENLQVKEVQIEGRRYVVCFNPEEAAKDRADREQILATLEKKLASGGVKRLIPNRGYRRFLKIRAGQCTIDQQRVEEDARYDGKYVLRTTTDLPADEVALAYKNLLWIERLFRDLKSLLETRPIYHHWVKDNVKGHIFACFLALYLVVVLRKKIAALGRTVEWADLMRDLSQLRAIGLQLDDQHYLLRTDLRGTAHVAFQAVGLRPPPLAQVLEGPPPTEAEV